MSDQLLDTCERVLRLVGTDAEAEVTLTSGTESLTRFATSFIHQNVADAVQRVHLRLALDGKVAEATGNQTDDDALDRLVRSATEAARLRPPDPGWPGLAPAARSRPPTPPGSPRNLPCRPGTGRAARPGSSTPAP